MGLNDLIVSLLESIQNVRDDWDTESSIQQADLAPSAHDTNILLAAITQGSGISIISVSYTHLTLPTICSV